MLPRNYRTDSEIRKQQINTLKVFNDKVKQVEEGSEYQISFNSGGNSFTLIVTLTTDFPKDKPILKVSPVIVHPWVNSEGEVTSAPGLLNYNTAHSDLGRVVQAVIREFVTSPPHLASEQTGSNITSPTVPIRDSDAMGRLSPSYPMNYLNRQSFSPPGPGTSYIQQATGFPELNTLPLDELHFLNDSVERREEFLGDLPQSRDINKTIDDLISQIEELADSNLSKEETLSSLQKDVEVRIEEVTKLAFENERLNVVFQTLSDKYSPRNIKEQLKLAAEKTNLDSERIADTFLQGKMDVDEFVSLYLQSRTLSQTRKTKEEKLSQQLHSLERAGF